VHSRMLPRTCGGLDDVCRHSHTTAVDVFSLVYCVGILLGIAVRTGSPLNLSLAEPVWKQLAGMSLSVTDLNEIDKDYVPGSCRLYCHR